MTLLTGTLVNGERATYRIKGVKGGCADSTVYVAEICCEPACPCIIKEITDRFMQEKSRRTAVNAFRAEAAEIMTRTQPDLVRLIDFFSIENRHHVVMEYVEGRNLASLLSSRKEPYGERITVEWGIRICRALYYLHIQNPPVTFGNLKPSSIILCEDGSLKLSEFGLALHFRSQSPAFDKGDMKSPYTPPEFFIPECSTDPRGDLYALGAILYEICTGQPPGNGFPMTKSIALELGVVIEKSTHADPEMRFKDAREMKNALVDALKNPDIGRAARGNA
ncbi:MAG: serine/threonine protein kinase [Vulcanimicrobiota bacterium]